MPWLERLDAAVKRQHWLIHGPYWALRWYLVGLGAFCVMRLMLDRLGLWSIY